MKTSPIPKLRLGIRSGKLRFLTPGQYGLLLMHDVDIRVPQDDHAES